MLTSTISFSVQRAEKLPPTILLPHCGLLAANGLPAFQSLLRIAHQAAQPRQSTGRRPPGLYRRDSQSTPLLWPCGYSPGEGSARCVRQPLRHLTAGGAHDFAHRALILQFRVREQLYPSHRRVCIILRPDPGDTHCNFGLRIVGRKRRDKTGGLFRISSGNTRAEPMQGCLPAGWSDRLTAQSVAAFLSMRAQSPSTADIVFRRDWPLGSCSANSAAPAGSFLCNTRISSAMASVR